MFQKWAGEFFVRVSLFDLGVTYQLGHDGGPCLIPSRTFELTVFNMSGVQRVRIKYCHCSKPYIPSRRQLFNIDWFPATIRQPGTVFTFPLLDYLHELQTRSKLNLYDYHATQVSLENPCELKPKIVSVDDI